MSYYEKWAYRLEQLLLAPSEIPLADCPVHTDSADGTGVRDLRNRRQLVVDPYYFSMLVVAHRAIPLGIWNELTPRARDECTVRVLKRPKDGVDHRAVFANVGHQSLVAPRVETSIEG